MFETLQSRPIFVGVVHLAPLPGAPRAALVPAMLALAEIDARALARGGCDALIVENFGDVPFHKDHVPAETIAAMALALERVRAVAEGVPIGVNVLRNDARAALGLCAVSGAAFLRVNVHTGAAVTDQGVVEGRAAETLRERARLCPAASLWADVHVKHATPLSRESIGEAAADTWKRGLADVLIVSGAATGKAPLAAHIEEVREHAREAIVVLGSGLTLENADVLLAQADGAIVGTALKHGGAVENPVDEARVTEFARRFRALRSWRRT